MEVAHVKQPKSSFFQPQPHWVSSKWISREGKTRSTKTRVECLGEWNNFSLFSFSRCSAINLHDKDGSIAAMESANIPSLEHQRSRSMSIFGSLVLTSGPHCSTLTLLWKKIIIDTPHISWKQHIDHQTAKLFPAKTSPHLEFGWTDRSVGVMWPTMWQCGRPANYACGCWRVSAPQRRFRESSRSSRSSPAGCRPWRTRPWTSRCRNPSQGRCTRCCTSAVCTWSGKTRKFPAAKKKKDEKKNSLCTFSGLQLSVSACSVCAGETHSTDAGGQNHPAPLDEEDGFVANHVLDV